MEKPKSQKTMMYPHLLCSPEVFLLVMEMAAAEERTKTGQVNFIVKSFYETWKKNREVNNGLTG